jgi:NADH-quinone oxidoreductase subunit F
MDKPLTQAVKPGREYMTLQEYERTGGYQSIRKALKDMDPKAVQTEVENSTLRGRGGAAFNTGKKWSFVPSGNDVLSPKYLVANADEMEPGTFKDRLLMEGNPHLLVDGMITAAYAIGASVGYVFIRWAYFLSQERMRQAIKEAYEAGYLGKNILNSGFDFDLHVHTSAGRYMAGEETGLLNSLEGKPARPKAKPPYPPVSGLWGRPTVVNNVETLCNVPAIIVNGADWYRGLGLADDGGTKIYGVSGRIKSPGLWELPMGTPVRELIENRAGGMRDGFKLKGFLPGGSSTGLLTTEHMDVPLDFTNVQKAGSSFGTGTMIVIDDKTCIVGLCENLLKFYAQESCGWCTPCRDGLAWMHKTLHAIENGQGRMEDIDLIADQCGMLDLGNTFCALAPGAAIPIASALKYFRDDFERHIEEGRCPLNQR